MNSILPIATAVPTSPVIPSAIKPVVKVAVTRQVSALEILLARESGFLIWFKRLIYSESPKNDYSDGGFARDKG